MTGEPHDLPLAAPDTPIRCTSIIILTRNGLADTKACVESIRHHTPEPHELVFVDNGSTDGTLQWLQAQADVRLIPSEENLGFGGGCNAGLSAARGDELLLLNNDTIVTPGWLRSLRHELHAHPEHGVVGPRSNHVAGMQQLEAPGYDVEGVRDLLPEAIAGLDVWARQHAAQVGTTSTGFPRLIGFCMLMRRRVVDQIGGFDLRFGLGNFEDDDWCLRAELAGWRCRVAHAAYVHHHGSRTFASERIDYSATHERNWAYFTRKWGITNDLIHPQGGYLPGALLTRCTFDPHKHREPLLGSLQTPLIDELDASQDQPVHFIAGERLPAFAAEEELLDVARAACLAAARAQALLVLRVHPGDLRSVTALESALDELAAAGGLEPDVALAEQGEFTDTALLAAASTVWGMSQRQRRMLASFS